MKWQVYFIDAEGYEGSMKIEAVDGIEAMKKARNDSIEIIDVVPADYDSYID